MNDKPLISIIIPTYNRAHLIGETLDSILAQTYTKWECIVVDDGSHDKTEEVINTYSVNDSRIKYVHRPQDRLPGGNAARNYGFELSQGEYIQWVDSDDLIKPSKLEVQVNKLIDREGKIVCLCKAEMFNSQGKTRFKKSVEFSRLSFFEDYITRRLDMGTTQPLWRKSFLTTQGLYDEELRRGQDFDFLSRISSSEKFDFTYVDESLVKVRLDDNVRITSTEYDSKSHRYLLESFLKVNKMLISKDLNTGMYIKFLNILIGKILYSVQNFDYDTAIEAIKSITFSVKQNKYKFHFYRLRFIINFLSYSKNKGYHNLRRFLFIK